MGLVSINNLILYFQFQVHNSMERLNNPESLGTLKKLLLKQTKKRRRQKRKREEYQEMKADYRIRRQHIDKSIDNWLKDMQDVVERAKRVCNNVKYYKNQ